MFCGKCIYIRKQTAVTHNQSWFYLVSFSSKKKISSYFSCLWQQKSSKCVSCRLKYLCTSMDIQKKKQFLKIVHINFVRNVFQFPFFISWKLGLSQYGYWIRSIVNSLYNEVVYIETFPGTPGIWPILINFNSVNPLAFNSISKFSWKISIISEFRID